MLTYVLKRLIYTLPVAFGVSVVCFMLVHIAPGDPLTSVLPPDASQQLQQQMRVIYGFDRPLPVQYGLWLAKTLQGDLGTSIATGRSVASELWKALGNTLMLAVLATIIGFVLGCLFGFVAGYFRDSWIDKMASFISIIGVSVPHYWLGMVLVIIFSVQLNWLPATGAGPGGSADWAWDWAHVRHLILPAVTMSVIPMASSRAPCARSWPTSSARNSSRGSAPRGSWTAASSATSSKTPRPPHSRSWACSSAICSAAPS
jgi:peptide/nickel transport system permease protein